MVQVRVPLNVALLAFENLDAHGCFEKPGLEFEYTALKNSHGMMSKVLDDVLDLDRMELGTFSKGMHSITFPRYLADVLITSHSAVCFPFSHFGHSCESQDVD